MPTTADLPFLIARPLSKSEGAVRIPIRPDEDSGLFLAPESLSSKSSVSRADAIASLLSQRTDSHEGLKSSLTTSDPAIVGSSLSSPSARGTLVARPSSPPEGLPFVYAGSSYFNSPTTIGIPRPAFIASLLHSGPSDDSYAGRARSASAPPARPTEEMSDPDPFRSPPRKQHRKNKSASHVTRRALDLSSPDLPKSVARSDEPSSHDKSSAAPRMHPRTNSAPTLLPSTEPNYLLDVLTMAMQLPSNIKQQPGEPVQFMSGHLKTLLGVRS